MSQNDAARSRPIADPDTAHLNDAARVAERYAVAITPAMRDLIDPQNPADPIARQFLPDARELDSQPGDLEDPIGDNPHSPLPGIVHRYPDRLLLMPVTVCPVYCRFCFRRETVGQEDAGLLPEADLDAALSYIRENESVWEVILSGGDPLLLSARRLGRILDALEAIDHVRVIRVHTRVPVVAPERVSEQLAQTLRRSKAVFVVLHTNHVNELTPAARQACAQLVDNGIPMLSQSVLLKGINDNAVVLENLLRALVENRIKPYYLHHADKAPGTAHLRSTIEHGQELLRELRGKVSGLCQPEFMLDIPGGHGKVPVGPVWYSANEEDAWVADPQGMQHAYTESVSVSD